MGRQEQLILGLSVGACALVVIALGLSGPARPPVAPGAAAAREIPKIATVTGGDALDLNPYVAQGKTLVEFTAEW